MRIDFPLHLWGEIGHWWQLLRWGDRSPGQLRGVTWLELVTDLEIFSGVNCMRPSSIPSTWGERAELLRGIVKFILKVRAEGSKNLEVEYGTSRRITSFASFGALHLSGLSRRPAFASGEAAIKAAAVNAWQWAEEAKVNTIQLHVVSYKGFARGGGKQQVVLAKLYDKAAQEGRRITESTARSVGTQKRGRRHCSSFE